MKQSKELIFIFSQFGNGYLSDFILCEWNCWWVACWYQCVSNTLNLQNLLLKILSISKCVWWTHWASPKPLTGKVSSKTFLFLNVKKTYVFWMFDMLCMIDTRKFFLIRICCTTNCNSQQFVCAIAMSVHCEVLMSATNTLIYFGGSYVKVLEIVALWASQSPHYAMRRTFWCQGVSDEHFEPPKNLNFKVFLILFPVGNKHL